jgi:hypothetical protein
VLDEERAGAKGRLQLDIFRDIWQLEPPETIIVCRMSFVHLHDFHIGQPGPYKGNDAINIAHNPCTSTALTLWRAVYDF